MKKLCVVLVCGLIACWLCGCGGGSGALVGDDQVTLQQDKAFATAQYFPLKIGNVWRFKDGLNTVTWRITGTETAGGKLWYTETLTSSTGGVAGMALYRHSAAGLSRRANGTEWVVLKAPVRKNAVWTGTDETGQTVNFRIISVATTVTVPAGTYSNCVVVDATTVGMGYRARVWYAPNTGIVKNIDYVGGVPLSTRLLRTVTLR